MDAQDPDSSFENFISLPRFQRGLVWGEAQKRGLIESLFQGFPVGAILGFDTGVPHIVGDRSRRQIELIDGLQRTTTIIQFLREPLRLAPIAEMFDHNHIIGILEHLGIDPSRDAIDLMLEAVESWARRCKVKDRRAGFKEEELAKAIVLSGVLPMPMPDDSRQAIEDYLSNILEEIEESVEAIERTRIPLIVYSGDREFVPTIFERVNSQGIKLSKYERFAAVWINTRVDVSNVEIFEAIKAKYAQLIDEGYEVEDFGENISLRSADVTLFEYLFGLGKILSVKFPHLFPESPAADDSPAVGFVLATVAHGLKIADMAKLAGRLQGQNISAAISLDAFEKAVLASCDAVEKCLRVYMQINLNKQGSTVRFLPHSQNQINSLVLRYLVEAFDPTTWLPKRGHSGKKFLSNFPAHYLQDILLGRWAGSGDSRLWEMVWGTDSRPEPSDYYLEAIPREQLAKTLDTWHGEQLQRRQKERGNVSSEAKTVLKFIYSSIITVRSDLAESYDLEHLFPVAKLVRIIESDSLDAGWPISALGNLCILPSSINRIKGEQMLGDYLRSTASDLNSKQRAALQDCVVTPPIEDLVVPADLDVSVFKAFCEKRFAVLRDHVVDELCP